MKIKKDAAIVPTFVSIGYERRSADDLIEHLESQGVSALVDVRESAFSRKTDFRKKRLTELLSENGIDYFHVKVAGNPFRKEATDIERCLELYREYLTSASVFSEIVSQLNEIVGDHEKVALLCYEKDPMTCHRTVLVNELKKSEYECDLIEV